MLGPFGPNPIIFILFRFLNYETTLVIIIHYLNGVLILKIIKSCSSACIYDHSRLRLKSEGVHTDFKKMKISQIGKVKTF